MVNANILWEGGPENSKRIVCALCTLHPASVGTLHSASVRTLQSAICALRSALCGHPHRGAAHISRAIRRASASTRAASKPVTSTEAPAQRRAFNGQTPAAEAALLAGRVCVAIEIDAWLDHHSNHQLSEINSAESCNRHVRSSCQLAGPGPARKGGRGVSGAARAGPERGSSAQQYPMRTEASRISPTAASTTASTWRARPKEPHVQLPWAGRGASDCQSAGASRPRGAEYCPMCPCAKQAGA
jgi:hypothetical protein